jgi:hypothetical protein
LLKNVDENVGNTLKIVDGKMLATLLEILMKNVGNTSEKC